MSEGSQVTVVGSLNVDSFTRVDSLPKPGETVLATNLQFFRGGKGANQAISAARQGCRVVLIGAVGRDETGKSYREALKEEGIIVSHVRQVAVPTGAAYITVDRNGENMIVIAPGANAELKRAEINRADTEIAASDAILMQFEVPVSVLVEAATRANEIEIPLIINPSPFNPTFPWEDISTDYVIVNESEAVELLGFSPVIEDISTVLAQLHQMRIRTLIMTRGGDDTLVFRRDGDILTIPVLPVLPIDTVGAGDAFTGCFAARIAQGETLLDALYAANCAGALTTLGAGAQDPSPDRERINQHIAQLKHGHPIEE
jgi:ribokinase